MNRRVTVVAGSAALAAGLFWFQSCGPMRAQGASGREKAGAVFENGSGTTTDNPKVIGVNVHIDGYLDGVNSSYCAVSVTLSPTTELPQQTERLKLDAPVYVQSQSPDHGSNLGLLEIPPGTYEKIEVQLSPGQCGGGVKSLEVKNATGEYSQTQALSLTFQGPFDVDERTANLSLDITELLQSFSTVSRNEDLRSVVQATPGKADHCGGYSVGGICYYRGADGESCNTVCADVGGCNSDQIQTLAEDSDLCLDVASTLAKNNFSRVSTTVGAALGCIENAGNQDRRVEIRLSLWNGGAVSCSGGSQGVRRICACGGGTAN